MRKYVGMLVFAAVAQAGFGQVRPELQKVAKFMGQGTGAFHVLVNATTELQNSEEFGPTHQCYLRTTTGGRRCSRLPGSAERNALERYDFDGMFASIRLD